ncbi:unnamed protein product [Brachionus calyciflorus]|uniref:BEN domain-containing protein n=1 Tax=Brachionus calyciflorus TaxID=104777 RepID=A0A813YIU5_9BILA|nr:unnamed protein product [Brachionus calyciflorus]
MPLSTPIKRKNKKSHILIDSDKSDDYNIEKQRQKTPRTEKLTRKKVQLTSEEDDEDTGVFFLVQFVSNLNRYDIVAEKQVTLDDIDSSVGIVKHYSKEFKVNILKKGSSEYIEKMAKKYSFNLPLKTTDESEIEKLVTRNQNINSNNLNNQRDIEPPRCIFTNDLFQSQTPASSRISILKQNGSLDQTISIDVFKEFSKEISLKLESQKKEYEILKEQLGSIQNSSQEKNFVYNGKDLIKEVHGSKPKEWALECCKVLFNEEEIKNCVLVSSNKTSRLPCSPNRVKFLKEAILYKYKSISAEKHDIMVSMNFDKQFSTN